MIAQTGAEVLGLDPNPTYIEYANRIARENTEFATADVGHPGGLARVPDLSMDTVFISDALLFYFFPPEPDTEHSLDALFSDIRRVLKPDGRLISVEPHHVFWLQPWLGDVDRPYTIPASTAIKITAWRRHRLNSSACFRNRNLQSSGWTKYTLSRELPISATAQRHCIGVSDRTDIRIKASTRFMDVSVSVLEAADWKPLEIADWPSHLCERYDNIALISDTRHLTDFDRSDASTLIVTSNWLQWQLLSKDGWHCVYIEQGYEPRKTP